MWQSLSAQAQALRSQAAQALHESAQALALDETLVRPQPYSTLCSNPACVAFMRASQQRTHQPSSLCPDVAEAIQA